MKLLLTLILGSATSNGYSAPSALEVNFKPTHERFRLADRKHIPLVEMFSADGSLALPSFGWKLYSLGSDLYNISQHAFEIEIYHEFDISHTSNTNCKRDLIWASDRVESSQHFFNMLMNKKQAFDSKIFPEKFKWHLLSFRVRSIFNDAARSISPWSALGRFLVTSASLSDWNNASFIAQDTTTAHNIAVPSFSKSFITASGKTISSAVISLVGLGFFRLFINEHDILALQNPPVSQIPGWTNTQFRVPYAAFDVTAYLSSSVANHMTVFLGEGYRNTTAYPPKNGARDKSDAIDCILKAQLMVRYSDGSQNVVISDDTWTSATSQVVSSSIYNGETWDQTAEIRTQSVVTVTGPPGVLSATVQPYVSIQRALKPVRVYPLAARDSQVVDFGTNSGGIVRLSLAGLALNSGDRIQMKFAEVRQHPPYGQSNGQLYYDNLRSAQQYDTFVSDRTASAGMQSWQPWFTVHGFQYVEIWGYPRPITADDIEKLEVYADVVRRANWTSSDADLNIINQMCINGQLSNLKSVLTDCNQRDERLGWLGDAALSSDTYCINFDMKSFLRNELQLMHDELGSDGSLPDVVPFYRYGNRPSDPNWGLAFPQIMNALYRYYGNGMDDVMTQYMQHGFPQYITSLESRMPKHANGTDNIAQYPASYGDWVPPPPNAKISNNFAGAFGFIETARLVKSFAGVIGNASYESYLKNLQTTLTSEFMDAFYDESQGFYLTGLQTSYAMSLHAEIYSDDDMKSSLQKNFLAQIDADQQLLTTGIIGAKFMLPVLAAMNQVNLTLALIKGKNASYPSWLYAAEDALEPATAVWEIWNAPSQGPGMNSRNHHMYSSVSAFLNTAISGIKNTRHNHWTVSIGHLQQDELRWSRWSTDEGLVVFNWEWQNDHILAVELRIPLSHTASVKIDLKGGYRMIHGQDEEKTGVKMDSEWRLMDGKFMSNEITAFFKQYNAQETDCHCLVFGSGHYSWTFVAT